MRRSELEHVIRAAGAIAEAPVLVILGSQAILGRYPTAPEALLASREVDLYPLEAPQRADLIDGSIGELSPFHDEFGYYAHGVGPETAVLPAAWRSRLVAVSNENTSGVTGLCLHPADLAVSKLVAGRDKDLAFVRTLLSHGLVSETEIRNLLVELPPEHAAQAAAALAHCRR
ncbi:MAG: DUF6036 family nucleotidyltransferase [Candidatus Latescibacterota bacterium]